MRAVILALGLMTCGATVALAQYVPQDEGGWGRRVEQHRADEQRARELREDLQRVEARISEFDQERAHREEWRARHEEEERRNRNAGGFGRWERSAFPYEEREHEFCQQRARQVWQMEQQVAAGRSDHKEREMLIGLKTDLDNRCRGYRFHG